MSPDERRHRTSRPADPSVPPGQPRGRTGDEPRTARSPLTLRLLLAAFGAVVCGVFAVLWLTADEPPGGSKGPGIVLLGLAVVAVVDLVVITLRLRRGRTRGR
ncbi:DUF6343 family protein [Kineococcus esterisolvens]|uniref:DUF6343 family protein n=1 Tax=unclassified Kineococcus TaxID=2621656 RepID=UPI003D7EDABD